MQGVGPPFCSMSQRFSPPTLHYFPPPPSWFSGGNLPVGNGGVPVPDFHQLRLPICPTTPPPGLFCAPVSLLPHLPDTDKWASKCDKFLDNLEKKATRKIEKPVAIDTSSSKSVRNVKDIAQKKTTSELATTSRSSHRKSEKRKTDQKDGSYKKSMKSGRDKIQKMRTSALIRTSSSSHEKPEKRKCDNQGTRYHGKSSNEPSSKSSEESFYRNSKSTSRSGSSSSKLSSGVKSSSSRNRDVKKKVERSDKKPISAVIKPKAPRSPPVPQKPVEKSTVIIPGYTGGSYTSRFNVLPGTSGQRVVGDPAHSASPEPDSESSIERFLVSMLLEQQQRLQERQAQSDQLLSVLRSQESFCDDDSELIESIPAPGYATKLVRRVSVNKLNSHASESELSVLLGDSGPTLSGYTEETMLSAEISRGDLMESDHNRGILSSRGPEESVHNPVVPGNRTEPGLRPGIPRGIPMESSPQPVIPEISIDSVQNGGISEDLFANLLQASADYQLEVNKTTTQSPFIYNGNHLPCGILRNYS